MQLLITGSSSHLSRATLPLLCEHPDISRIIGLDIKPAVFSHAKFEHRLIDIRDINLSTHMVDIEAVIHMAFVVQRGDLGQDRHNMALIRDINITGSLNVFESARRCQVKQIIHLSSAIIYVNSTQCNTPYLETSPYQAISGFPYSEHKVELEQWLNNFTSQYTSPCVTRLRPHIILGQHAQPLLQEIFRSPWIAKLKMPEPTIQCVWENDVAQAILQALWIKIPGSFNLCCDEHSNLRQMKQYLLGKTRNLPFSLVKYVHQLCWQFTGKLGEPAWFNTVTMDLHLNNAKAKQQLNWQPSINLWECLDTIELK